VEKCQAEGLEVKNHMSVISAGLAATIREWFSEGENTSTVETAKKVDLKKVRIKKKVKRKKAAKKPKAEGPEGEESEALKAAEEKDRAEPASAGGSVGEVVVEMPEQPEQEQPGAEPEQQEPTLTEPEPIIPAGPILERPEPARLSGPEVIRVEAPEPLGRPSRPKSRPRPRPRYDAPVTEPLIQDEEKLAPGLLELEKKGGKKAAKRSNEKAPKHRRSEPGLEEPPRRFRAIGGRRQRDIEERRARLEAARGEGQRLRPSRKISTKPHTASAPGVRPTKASVSEPITVKDLSAALAVKSSDIITKLMQQGVMVTANQTVAADVAELVALEFGIELVVESKRTLEEQIRTEFEQRERRELTKRSAVVTMLGHVDHGKTSLLDKIRSSHVTATEAGGITQHMGAYQVRWNNSRVTFLDTPGHEAFTAMRARGANMTDVVVLVVAADDGVMPQTVEAIHHAQAANVPIVVALNKIDLPGVDVNRIYAQLSEHDLTPSEWGGETEVVKTSAVTGEGIDDLLEHLDYIAELLELRADNTIPATGWVVEAKKSAKQGPVATLLIKEGRLSKGDVVLAGGVFGRVKRIKDSQGKSIKQATSSMPVEISGLSDVAQAGDRFYCLDDINKAKAAAEEYRGRARENMLARRTRVTLDNLFSQLETGKIKELNLIVRADVQGSADVLTEYLSELSTDEVKVRILHAAVGGITEGDVLLAEASNAIIIGFNVVADEHAAKIAEANGIDIRLYNVIYHITEDLKKSMEGLLEPEEQEKSLGRAIVRTTFKISKVGTVAGCYVSDGIVTNKAKVRLIRDNIVIRDSLSVESLKHFKDDVREVKAGLECGIKISKFNDIKVDDVLDFYEIVEVARTL